ncbi:MAG: M28 family peptidase [Betaproteobacteria bacterium]
MRKLSPTFVCCVLATLFVSQGGGAAVAATLPADAETRAWWAITASLSNDAMAGRDTGSADYDRAAHLVAERLAAAGLVPMGDRGSWLQNVPMDEIRFERAAIDVGRRPLRLLHDVFVAPTESLPATVDAPLAYRGYCAADALGDVRGKLVVCHGTRRPELTTGAQREATVRAAGGVGIVAIADPGYALEPPRWPFAYARSVSLADAPRAADSFVRSTLNAASLKAVLARDTHDAARLIADGSQGSPLPSFDIGDRFHAVFAVTRRQIVSPNVIGLLPGSDPSTADQALVLSAHLDGYGVGTAVRGDRIYNGTLDDTAYVALLIRLAEQRHGNGYRRPILFIAWTGEEKGLLGSEWFVTHPTVALPRIAANINLDQLRPIFPLELLTVHALDDTTLGDDVRAVAGAMGIAVQRDPEPERNLLRRSDQWNFLKAGIPATAFVFGYRPGTQSERIYRAWYRTGYHKPQDDLDQLMDWKAAADFNRFFRDLVARVADQPAAPSWKVGSELRPNRVIDSPERK